MQNTIKNINKLLASLPQVTATYGRRTSDDEEVTSLCADSRAVESGAMFVAVRGPLTDAHRFIPAAISSGARVIVCEDIPGDNMPDGVLWVRVPSSAAALGHLASCHYGDPSRHLTLVGVTGTNGKTTIATLLYDMARKLGHKAGLLSTVVNKIDEREVEAHNTTPGPLELNALLAEMVDSGCTFAAMEVSSHAAHQHRIDGLHYAGGIFTNLTRDHLDYHKTVEAYLAAKKSFFDMLPPDAFALTNADDRNGSVMLQNTPAHRRCTYSVRGDADFRARVVEDRIDGMLLEFNGREVETMFVGRFNASNLAAVYGACILLGYHPDDVLPAISSLHPVAGRFQPFRSAEGVTAIVDYAHTPDALVNVLDTINEVARRGAQIITVVGCGGDRDRGKRPIMAAEAARRSTRLVLTSDNPRTENPQAILDDMAAGLDATQAARTLTIADRRQAIRTAAALAHPGDIILVAGKGHETYQIIGTEIRHHDDREEVCAALGIPFFNS